MQHHLGTLATLFREEAGIEVKFTLKTKSFKFHYLLYENGLATKIQVDKRIVQIVGPCVKNNTEIVFKFFFSYHFV